MSKKVFHSHATSPHVDPRSPQRQLALGLASLILLAVLCSTALPVAATPSQPDATTANTTSNFSLTQPVNHSLQQRETPRQQIPRGIQTIYNSTEITHPTGGANVTVAVLDSGVDTTHPDLEDRLAGCRDFTQSPPQTGECTDENGHGSHVAGTILADAGPNNTGIYGIAPDAELLAYKVCSKTGQCKSDTVASGLRAAVNEDADIVVLSLGGKNPGGQALDSAIAHADREGTLIIAAAGNTGPDLDSIEYPAADPRVVGVGATTLGGEGVITPAKYAVPDFSSRGINASEFKAQDRYLEVAGPGQSVLSTWRNDGYRSQSGTSVAVPHIAGFAALLWPHHSSPSDRTTASEMRRMLRDRATWLDIERGAHARAGYDPAAGIGIPVRTQPHVDISINPRLPAPQTSVTFSATNLSAPDSEIDRFVWDFTGDGAADAEGQTVTHTFDSPGQYVVHLRAVDQAGASVRTQSEFRVNAPPRANFAINPTTPLVGTPVRFDAIGLDPDGSAVSYAWDFDSDGNTDATGPATSHTYTRPGDQTVSLSVTDSDGATTTVEQAVRINDKPTISIEAPDHAMAGELVEFTATVDNEIGDVTITWEFPDGTLATGPTVQREFPPGPQQITVQVVDEYGATGTSTHHFTSQAPTPTPPTTDSPTPQTVTLDPPPTRAPPIPGFTILTAGAALLILLAISGLARHRRP